MTRRGWMRPAWPAAAAALAALVALAGCAEKTTSNVAIAETASGNVVKNLVVHDPAFAKRVKVMDLRVGQRGDLLEGYVVLQNVTDETVEFEYKMEWYDADDMALATPIESWKPGLLYGRETKGIREVAPRTDAAGFKFFVREPTPVDW